MTFTRLSGLFLLTILISCLTTLRSHVVFEEIGTMVGSVSYLHVAIAVNTSAITSMVANATMGIRLWSQRIGSLYNRHAYDNGGLNQFKEMDRQYYDHLQTFFEDSLARIQFKVQDLKQVLPKPPAEHHRGTRSVPLELLKAGGAFLSNIISAPNFFISLAQGVFGTFMGLYNARQLSKLRHEVAHVQEVQNRLVAISVNHEHRIRKVETEVEALKTRATIQSAVHAPLAVARMDRIRAEIQDALNTVIHTAQAAQQHRLAIDLLSAQELNQLYNDIQKRAEVLHYSLLTRMATDLFQVEVSYLYDGETLMLLLHIPMVPKQSLLTLYRFHPFPIPFSSDKALMPKPSSSVLAISQAPPWLTTTIELVDLVNCHRINSVYVCERHGILNRDTKATCLGALFENDVELAQTLCELELVPYQEYALQLESNWFLIYSPKMFTSFARCLNGTVFELQVKMGVNKLFIDPTCSSDLQNLILISDISFQLDNAVKHFEWSRADLAAFGVSDQDIQDTVLDLDNLLVEQELLLSEVLAHKKMRSRVPWLWIWAIIGTLASVVFLYLLSALVGLCNLRRLQHRLLAVRRHLGLAPNPQPDAEAELQVLRA